MPSDGHHRVVHGQAAVVSFLSRRRMLCREGNLEQAASFTSAAWEDRGATAVHALDVLSEHYAPLVYHGGYKLAGTTQVSASRAFVFAGASATCSLSLAHMRILDKAAYREAVLPLCCTVQPS